MGRLTDSELQIMKCIWDADHQLALSEILKRVNERFHKDWKPQTASTFVSRLVQKGFLRLDRSVRYYSYEIVISEDEYLKTTVEEFADFWGEGIAAKFVTFLSKDNRITSEEAAAIRLSLDAIR